MSEMIRVARVDDYDAFARLFPELRIDDPTPSEENWRAKIMPTTLIAEESGEVIGYLFYELFAAEGHIRHVVVAPQHHGKRIGQLLMERVAALMTERGLARWALNVKPDNTSAIRLYERMGMRQAYTAQALRFAWDLRERLPAAAGIRAFMIVPSRDGEVEIATRMSTGQLASARRNPDNVLVAVEDEGGVVGAAVFAPKFPGAFPFRAASPEAARALLDAIHPHALEQPPYMQVVVEGEPELAAALREVGALLRLDILHYKGAIPN